jgi:hypothetical protein
MTAAATGHKQTSDRVEFCRVPNCKQTDYRDVCPVPWKSEAHHILCVAQVNAAVVSKKPEVQKVIDESKWCINSKINMIALPLWGTTVLYYCTNFSSVTPSDLAGLKSGIAGSLLSSTTAAPPFENLPQHNYGHSGKTAAASYNLEIKKKLEDKMTEITADVQAHSITGDDVHSDLNDMASDMRTELETRGKRVGSAQGKIGTHEAWLNPGPVWYLPFSMAKVPKPLPSPKMIQKIIKIAQALWRG